jgi:iron complex transport system permease protein
LQARRTAAWMLLASFTLLGLALISLSVGSYNRLRIAEVLHAIARPGSLNPIERGIVAYRALRTLAAIVVGASLAYSGANLQYVFRNPLADPYVFGVASGAALGVVLALYLGVSRPHALYAASFLGALGALAVVMSVALLAGGSAFAYIVAGVSIGYLLWALSIIIIMVLGPRSHYGLLWLFGTLAYAEVRLAEAGALLLAVVSVASIALSARYSKLMLGPEVASVHGVSYKRAILELVVASGLATSLATTIAGPVGFVGIVAPWAARFTAKSLYGPFAASSMLWGASLVLFGDIVARLMGGSRELPLTAILSLIGVPVIAYILARSRGVSSW